MLTGWAESNEWALQWVEEIGTLYQRNNHRLAVKEDAVAYVVADRSVCDQVEQMRQRCEKAETSLATTQGVDELAKSGLPQNSGRSSRKGAEGN